MKGQKKHYPTGSFEIFSTFFIIKQKLLFANQEESRRLFANHK